MESTRPIIPGGYNDKNAEGNSSKYHTGKPCINEGCENPAGTSWSPYWCIDCNIERMDHISDQMDQMLKQYKAKTTEERTNETTTGTVR